MMDVKVSKDKHKQMHWSREPHLCLMKWHQKPCIKTKKVIDRGKRSKPLSEVKPVENISNSPHSLLEISLVQKQVLPSHDLQGHAYKLKDPFGLKGDNP